MWDKGTSKQYKMRLQQIDIRVADDFVFFGSNTIESGLLEYGDTCCPSADRLHAGQSENVVTTAPNARCYGQQDHKL
jgi:hypothetical protein